MTVEKPRSLDLASVTGLQELVFVPATVDSLTHADPATSPQAAAGIRGGQRAVNWPGRWPLDGCRRGSPSSRSTRGSGTSGVLVKNPIYLVMRKFSRDKRMDFLTGQVPEPLNRGQLRASTAVWCAL
jgi:hypothetical protein